MPVVTPHPSRARGRRRPGPRRVWSGATGVALVVVLGGCSAGPSFGAPEPASRQGQEVLDLWRGSNFAAFAVGGLVWGLIVWAGLRYRARNDDIPSQAPYNIPLEVAYTVIPLVVVAVLFGFTVATQERVTAEADEPDLVVEVTGFQWSWQFTYPAEGVVVRSDGQTPPELAVPVGSTVHFDLRSVDVAHSFWVPELLVKRDLIPGVDNGIDVDVTRAGEWTGRCAEFCGLEHWSMIFTFRALEPAGFEAWLEQRRAEGDVVDAGADRTEPAVGGG